MGTTVTCYTRKEIEEMIRKEVKKHFLSLEDELYRLRSEVKQLDKILEARTLKRERINKGRWKP